MPLNWIVDRPPTKAEACDFIELFVTYHNGTIGIEDGNYVRESMADHTVMFGQTVIAWMPRPEPYQPTTKEQS